MDDDLECSAFTWIEIKGKFTAGDNHDVGYFLAGKARLYNVAADEAGCTGDDDFESVCGGLLP